MKNITLLVVFLLLSLDAVCAQSQQSKPPQKATPASAEDDVVRIDVNLIQVEAVVSDKKGRQVTNLKAEDFSLIENGRSHPADYCVYVPLAPNEDKTQRAVPGTPPTAAELARTFVFLVDNPRIEFASTYTNLSRGPSINVYLQQRVIRGAIEAERLLTSFLDTEVGPNDLVAIADTEVNLGVLSSFTNDRSTLREAVRQVRNNPNSARVPVIRVSSVGGTLILVDLIKQNLRVLETVSNVIKQLSTLPGRKVVTLLSRGILFDPRYPGADAVIQRMEKLIDEANRSRVSIYALSPAGVGNFGGDTLQNFDSLIRLARETGGRAVFNTNDTRVGFAEIVEKTRGYYLLAYKSDPETQTRPHKVQVRLSNSDLQVEARQTAYSRVAAVPKGDPLEPAINSPLRETAIPIEVSHSVVSNDISLDIRVGLTEGDLLQSNEALEAEFEIAWRVTGPEGELKPTSTNTVKLKGKAPDKIRLIQEGLLSRLQIPAEKSGFYRISVAVRSKHSGQVGSTNLLIPVNLTKRH